MNTTKAADNNFSLEQYIIEYGEAHLDRDHVLSAYRCVLLAFILFFVALVAFILSCSHRIPCLHELCRLKVLLSITHFFFFLVSNIFLDLSP